MSDKASAGGAAINLLQITDCHLTKDLDGELLGVTTRESFAAVLERALSDIDDGVCPKPDFVIATGDLAQDASVEAYSHFRDQIRRIPCPSRWFSGNHDDRDILSQVLSNGEELSKVLRVGNWQILTLDSSVKGSVHGCLGQDELSVLENALVEQPNLNTLISFHHHPVDIGSTWLDRIGLHNRDDFFQIIDKYDNIKGILWGHIHQDFESARNGVRLLATPSTCIQFTPKSHDFAVEAVAPGYRWLRLYDNGDIDTKVVRVEDYEFTLDMESKGY